MLDDALLQYTKLQEFEAPSHRPVEVLKGWLDRPEGGDFFLRGREAEIWDEDKDLIAVAPSQDRGDSLIWLISDKIVPWYHRRWGHRKKVTSVRDPPRRTNNNIDNSIKRVLALNGMVSGIMRKKVL